MTITITNLTEVKSSSWDTYVKQHAEGTFFHLSGWQKVVSSTFGHDCYYLLAEEAEKVVGVLPLVEVKSALFGHALVSTPFCVYGGAIADSDEVKRQLEQHAVSIAERLEVDYLELRYKHAQDNGMLVKQAHSTFGCELAEDEDAILAKVKKKQRAVIRHALKKRTDVSNNSIFR